MNLQLQKPPVLSNEEFYDRVKNLCYSVVGVSSFIIISYLGTSCYNELQEKNCKEAYLKYADINSDKKVSKLERLIFNRDFMKQTNTLMINNWPYHKNGQKISASDYLEMLENYKINK